MSEQLDNLTTQLRDCLERLRLIPAESLDAAEVPPSLQAALVGADLLARFGDQTGYPAFASWLRSLRDLLQWLHDHPGAGFPELSKGLAPLADYLESLIKRLDDGEELPSLVRIDDLQSLQHAFVPSSDDGPVARPAAPVADNETRRVLLWLSTSMWVGEILAKLSRTGFDVDVCDSLETVIRRLEAGPPYQVLIIDNIEPSVNLCRLATVRDDLDRLDHLSWPPLVLVTTSTQQRLEEIAYRFGAVGIWRSPWPARSLNNLLSRGPV